MDEIDAILRAASGRAEEAEVFFSTSESIGAELSRDRVRIGQAGHAMGLGIRVFAQGRVGASSTNDPGRWEACLDGANNTEPPRGRQTSSEIFPKLPEEPLRRTIILPHPCQAA